MVGTPLVDPNLVIRTAKSSARVKQKTAKTAQTKIIGFEIESNRKPAEKPPDGLYYNWNAILSKNRLFNFVVGIRGGGKTYGATKFLINSFLKRGKKTIWLRRQATELNSIFTRGFFKEIAINGEFPEYDFKVQSSQVDGISYGYIREHKDKNEWKQMCLFMPLSIALKQKSTFMLEYDYIFFDEFLIDPRHSNLTYLNGWNEPLIFLEFFESVNRTRDDVRAFFIGNALSSVNPYFDFFQIKFNKNKEWLLTEDVAVHNYKNETFKRFKTSTRWGRFLERTQYGKYNLDNEFINENEDFIAEPPKNSYLMFNVRYMKNIYGIYANEGTGKIYATTHTDKTFTTFCFTTDDMRPNMLLIDQTRGKSNTIAGTIRKAYKNGYLCFDSQETKQKLIELIEMLV